jgi:hypothetical protein
MHKKRGQVTIFVIIGIIIVVSLSLFFVFRSSLFQNQIPQNLEPVYNTFLGCLEEDTLTGIDVLESQGGYIEVPTFEPGSKYMPFSSQLEFLGSNVPYWYYVSRNNLPREQIPTKTEMEDQLGDFVSSQIGNCLFDSYYDEGYEVYIDTATTDIEINKENVEVKMKMDMNISRGDENVLIREHNLVINSELGELYDDAREIYEYSLDTEFLENYAIDSLRLYAPVDGVELTCSPLVWNAEEVFDEVLSAVEGNILAIKSRNSDFTLTKEINKYFIQDFPIENDVRFITSKDWPNSMEVSPSNGPVLVSEPVGNQPGLGILGFCYVPYHFVYDLKFPVMIQIFGEEEFFQFPYAVVIDNNKPKEAISPDAQEIEIFEFCENANTPTTVRVLDLDFNPVQANLTYSCSASHCNLGETDSSGVLDTILAQCQNGFVLAKASGYRDSKEKYSSVESGEAIVIMYREYELPVNLLLDSREFRGSAVISFVSNDSSTTILYPEQKSVLLSEGQYEVQTYIYENSSLKLSESIQEFCYEVPQSKVGSLFGLTKEECVDVTIPEQIISKALSGGGTENYYILDSMLEGSEEIEIRASSFPVPKSIEDLELNYDLFETKGLEINLR